MDIVIINGEQCFDFAEMGGYLKKYPEIETAREKRRYINIPYSNGSYIIREQCFDNVGVTLEYEFMAKPVLNINAIKTLREGILKVKWEETHRKIKDCTKCVLSLTDDKTYLLTVDLVLDPFEYVEGETITIENPLNVWNNNNIDSEPYLKIYASGDCALTINGEKIELLGVTDYIEIDTELLECYKGTESLNYKMIGDYPRLKIGENTISFTNVSKIELLPRWRCL